MSLDSHSREQTGRFQETIVNMPAALECYVNIGGHGDDTLKVQYSRFATAEPGTGE